MVHCPTRLSPLAPTRRQRQLDVNTHNRTCDCLQRQTDRRPHHAACHLSSPAACLCSVTSLARSSMNASDVDIAVVATPQQLLDAVLDDRKHILITDHLDLTILELRENTICPDGCSSPLPEIRATDSIRGNCSSPPSEIQLAVLANTPTAVALLPMQPNQCLLFTHEDTFPTLTRHIWMDNLYVRMLFHNVPADSSREWGYASLAAFPPLVNRPYRWHGQHYVTRCTFQGDGLGPAVGIWADENAYIENCTFANLGGDASGANPDACADCTGALNVHNVSVSVVNSVFFEPVPLPAASYVRVWNNARVLLSGCVFGPMDDDDLPPFVALDSSGIFSEDDADLGTRVRTDNGLETIIQASSSLPPVPPDANTVMLQRDDAWFVAVREELDQEVPLQPAYPAPTEPLPVVNTALVFPAPPQSPTPPVREPPSDGDGVFIAAIAGGVAAVVLLLVAAACCVLLLLRRRKRGSAKAGADGGEWPKDMIVTGGQSDALSMASGKMHGQWPRVHLPRGMSTASGVSTMSGGAFPAAGPTANRPQDGIEVADLLGLIHQQLDSVPPDAVLQQQFKLLGPSHRRQGGQSVVAFATGAYSAQPYIMKFYAVRAAYEAELGVRGDDSLQMLLPRIQSVHNPLLPPEQNSAIYDAAGRPMAPCIVMPRGESLLDWLHRATPDVFQAVSVLSHIAALLRSIHAAGYVHGNVKPAHVIHLRQENRWTLTDFDRAVRVGSPVAPVYTLPYSAPELVIAAGRGDASIRADPAMDSWSLGVVAFELLMGKPSFDPSVDRAAVAEAQLLGKALLPWEGERLNADTRYRLGIFCEPLLALLQRTPEARISASAFCDACSEIVASNTTTAMPDSMPASLASVNRT
eukprot:jgi/Ulvmu1/11950/UM082_0029.1